MDKLKDNAQFQLALVDKSLSFAKNDKDEWSFVETVHEKKGYAQTIRVDEFLLYKKSPFQSLAVFHNNELGNIMVLDGAVQIVEKNWRPYQEMLVAAALFPQCDDPEKELEVLIIGGGDGGVATVIQEFYPKIKVAVGDIDREVVDAAILHFPMIAKSLIAPKVNFTLHIVDGVEFVKRLENYRRFAAIIIDCTDPTGPALELFNEEFHRNAKACLQPNGILVQQSGVIDLQQDEVGGQLEILGRLYHNPFVFGVSMLTYPGMITLVGGSDANVKLTRQVADDRYEKVFKLHTKAEYFNPDIYFSGLPQKQQRWVNGMIAQAAKSKFSTSPLAFMAPPLSPRRSNEDEATHGFYLVPGGATQATN